MSGLHEGLLVGWMPIADTINDIGNKIKDGLTADATFSINAARDPMQEHMAAQTNTLADLSTGLAKLTAAVKSLPEATGKEVANGVGEKFDKTTEKAQRLATTAARRG
jgi:hypothetical protein